MLETESPAASSPRNRRPHPGGIQFVSVGAKVTVTFWPELSNIHSGTHLSDQSCDYVFQEIANERSKGCSPFISGCLTSLLGFGFCPGTNVQKQERRRQGGLPRCCSQDENFRNRSASVTAHANGQCA